MAIDCCFTQFISTNEHTGSYHGTALLVPRIYFSEIVNNRPQQWIIDHNICYCFLFDGRVKCVDDAAVKFIRVTL